MEATRKYFKINYRYSFIDAKNTSHKCTRVSFTPETAAQLTSIRFKIV
jgi:hypothetical protein